MKSCGNCGSTSMIRGRCKCGTPLCERCKGGPCRDCLIIKEDVKLITDYFTEKYTRVIA